MKNNKGVTITSLVIYIAVVILIMAMVIRITLYFRNNMADVADTSFETEFNKLNLYLLDESSKSENEILEIVNGTRLAFTRGNTFDYKEDNNAIYLNDDIKICENVQNCLFEEKVASNGKNVIALTIKISGIEKNVEYVMNSKKQQDSELNIQDYLVGPSLVTYHLKAGDYVDYVPDIGTYKVAAGEYGSGYSEMQSFTTETGENSLKWRVLSIDEKTGEIELVSETVGKTLYLKGADGYNHSVDILNDLCESLYSKTVNGKKIAVGRSINVEDINEKTTYDYTTYMGTYKYGTVKAFTDYTIDYRKYPNLYAKEEGMLEQGIGENEGLNDGTVNGDGITEYKTVNGYSNDYDSSTGTSRNNVTAKYTYYYYTPEKNIRYLGLNTVPKGLFNLGIEYWLATRGMSGTAEWWSFRIRIINPSGDVACATIFSSYSTENIQNRAVRPVVTLDATQLLDFTVGDGSKEKPWGMK